MTESVRNPEEFRPSREGAQTRGPSPSPYPTTAQQHATSALDVLAAALNSLSDRGITNPSVFAHLDAEAIEGTVRWFDAQAGRVGTGMLVNELRAGGKPGWHPSAPASMLDSQREYGDQICDWLTENFPELVDPRWGPHPAAITAVIHLHYRHGKGRLTKREHGREIRAAVKAFDAKWQEPA